jgi:hypothetical protein
MIVNKLAQARFREVHLNEQLKIIPCQSDVAQLYAFLFADRAPILFKCV